MGVFVGRIQYAPTAGETSKRASFFYTPRWMAPKCAAFYSYPERITPKFDPFYSHPLWRASKFDPFPDSPPMRVFVGRIQYAPTAGATSKRSSFFYIPRWRTPKCAAFYSYPERSTPKFDPFYSHPLWRTSKFDPFPDSPPMGGVCEAYSIRPYSRCNLKTRSIFLHPTMEDSKMRRVLILSGTEYP